MVAEVERRFQAEIRASGRRLEGYAATFGTEAKIAGFVETIQPGAFRASLASGADILALADHDPGKVLEKSRAYNAGSAVLPGRYRAYRRRRPDATGAIYDRICRQPARAQESNRRAN